MYTPFEKAEIISRRTTNMAGWVYVLEDDVRKEVLPTYTGDKENVIANIRIGIEDSIKALKELAEQLEIEIEER